MPKLQTNTLYYGDNLDVLRDYIPDESVDLIYLDPPFNSNRSYNVLFKDVGKVDSPAQIEAFEDTWHPGEAANRAFEEVAMHGTDDTARLLKAMVDALGHNDVTAYLSMMAVRLIEMHRVLKPTGSLYLHCDPTASHYLKVLMDSIFDPKNFRNEITWRRTNARSTGGRWPRLHDILLHYTKSDDYVFNPLLVSADKTKMPHTLITGSDGRAYQTYELTGAGSTKEGESGKPWRGFDPTSMGRHWANNVATLEDWDSSGLIHWPKKGGFPRRRAEAPFDEDARMIMVGDVWTDIDRINQAAKERLGYPTQKPLALLERIIAASSNEGDLVLDPFCGCGTAVHASQKLGRNWIGIDITNLAINLIRRRMEDAFPELTNAITVIGQPVDLPGAQDLADRDKYQFQWWALDRIGAMPAGGDKKKGMDRGIDGVIPFMEGSMDYRRVIVSVKGGGISSRDVRDLKGVLEREGAPIGVFVTMKPPTREMKTEAASAGMYASQTMGKSYPRLQILTIADVLNGKQVDMPNRVSPFAKAPVEKAPKGKQAALEL